MLNVATDILDAKEPYGVLGRVEVEAPALGNHDEVLPVRRVLDEAAFVPITRVFEYGRADIVCGSERSFTKAGQGSKYRQGDKEKEAALRQDPGPHSQRAMRHRTRYPSTITPIRTQRPRISV